MSQVCNNCNGDGCPLCDHGTQSNMEPEGLSPSSGERIDLIDELRWRGLLHQCTDEDGLRRHLETGTRRIYAGFDPTADSLTIGNLVPIMLLAHVKRAGHEAVVVMGGGTGLIGDPSGKSAERTLMTRERVAEHIRGQRPIFDAVLGGVPGPAHRVLNNLDWLGGLSYIDALRDIGKHFSVNMMMQKDSVKSRLESREQGISYTEFSYMILQAYDFAHLYEHEGVTVQMGGSDQFGNIVAGVSLITGPAFGLTAPLVTKVDGGKFGKTEAGAVWLTADRTSPYAYFQFWLNATDADAENWIKIFTFLDEATVTDLIARHRADPGARELQRRLAREATTILRGWEGRDEIDRIEAVIKAMFRGEFASLTESRLDEVFADVPSIEFSRSSLTPEGVEPSKFLLAIGLASSFRESREFLNSGAVSVNGVKINAKTRLTQDFLLFGSYMAVRRGPRRLCLVRWRHPDA